MNEYYANGGDYPAWTCDSSDDANCGCYPGHTKTTFVYNQKNAELEAQGYLAGDTFVAKTHSEPRKQCRNKPPPTGAWDPDGTMAARWKVMGRQFTNWAERCPQVCEPLTSICTAAQTEDGVTTKINPFVVAANKAGRIKNECAMEWAGDKMCAAEDGTFSVTCADKYTPGSVWMDSRGATENTNVVMPPAGRDPVPPVHAECEQTMDVRDIDAGKLMCKASLCKVDHMLPKIEGTHPADDNKAVKRFLGCRCL